MSNFVAAEWNKFKEWFKSHEASVTERLKALEQRAQHAEEKLMELEKKIP